jgi:COMM domain
MSGTPQLKTAEDIFDKRIFGRLQKIDAVPGEMVDKVMELVLDRALFPDRHAVPPQIAPLVDAYALLVRQAVKLSLDKEAVARDLLEARVSKENALKFATLFAQRADALRRHYASKTVEDGAASYLKDFDWQLHLQAGGDTIDSSREPLLLLALNVHDNVDKSAHNVHVELDIEQTDRLIDSLERAQQQVAQLSSFSE